MNPKSQDEQKNPFCVSSKKNKDNFKPAHWVGHSELISLDKGYFFNMIPGVDEKQASVTGNTMKQSVSGGERIQFYYKKKKKIYLKRLVMMLI